MPLSDDALEQLALLAVTEDASIRAKTARHYIPDLIGELRAARKVVAGYHDVRGEMSMHGPGFENSNAFWRVIEDADKALSAYDALNRLQPTSHPSGA